MPTAKKPLTAAKVRAVLRKAGITGKYVAETRNSCVLLCKFFSYLDKKESRIALEGLGFDVKEGMGRLEVKRG